MKDHMWKMPFGCPSHWTPDTLPPVLQRHYCLMPREGVINGKPEHHLTGFLSPSQDVLRAISETSISSQYLHLRMPFAWQKDYVWPSGEPGPVRCWPHEAIDYFHCDL